MLHVATDSEQLSYVLPDDGEVVVGRSRSCRVHVDDASVSRKHAVIALGADGFRVTDLGSSNGTTVRGERIEANQPIRFSIGDVVYVGSVMLTLRVGRASRRPLRVWPHGYFEGRVEEECARSARSGRSFAVLRVKQARARRGIIEDVLAATLRGHDVVAQYAPGELEVLLTEASPAQAEAVAARVTERGAEARLDLRTALVCFPRDGTSAESLMAGVAARLRGTPARDESELMQVPLSGEMHRVWDVVEQVAPSMVSVLIQGETGVGKEVCAEALHRLSPRAPKTFLRLHCAALPSTLIESELFGHERGAFTGAATAKLGLIESANGGTVFLDEIGELPPATQVKLLRVLDAREVLPIGALTPRIVDVRFIAATNRSLETEVAAGRFREDLYYRLAGMVVKIPPLRDRVGEIRGLAEAFAARAAGEQGRPTPEIAPAALAALERYAWPGNVRELRNVIERALVLCGAGPILIEHLPSEKLGTAEATRAGRLPPEAVNEFDDVEVTARMARPRELLERGVGDDAADGTLRDEVEALERRRVLDALDRCGGNQSQAARVLGMSRGALLARLRAWGVLRPRGERST